MATSLRDEMKATQTSPRSRTRHQWSFSRALLPIGARVLAPRPPVGLPPILPPSPRPRSGDVEPPPRPKMEETCRAMRVPLWPSRGGDERPEATLAAEGEPPHKVGVNMLRLNVDERPGDERAGLAAPSRAPDAFGVLVDGGWSSWRKRLARGQRLHTCHVSPREVG